MGCYGLWVDFVDVDSVDEQIRKQQLVEFKRLQSTPPLEAPVHLTRSCSCERPGRVWARLPVIATW